MLLQSAWLWSAILAAALFMPVRRLVWVLSVRREERRLGRATDDARRQLLRRRAGVTALLICVFFSAVYVHALFDRLDIKP
jgi:hypothetical protein